MNVRELIEKLSTLDPELIIVVSRDAEGNGFERAAEVVTGYVYDAEDREIGYSELTPELEEDGYSEEDLRDGDPCIVIWP